MKILAVAALVLCVASPTFAQLTEDQKITDFLVLVALFDSNYAPYEWKRDAFGYDMLKLQTWLAKVRAAKTDLEFYDVQVRYAASLNDYHVEVVIPPYYDAWLPLSVDIYDGKVLIDAIDRSVLNPQNYP